MVDRFIATIFLQEQQPEGSGAAVACHRRRRFLYIDPLERTILLYQVLDIFDLLGVHTGIGDEQDAAVYIPRVRKYLSDIVLRGAGKVAHLNSAHCQLAVSKNNNRMEQKGIADNLYPFGYSSGLAHEVGIVDDECRGYVPSQPFYRFYDLLL